MTLSHFKVNQVLYLFRKGQKQTHFAPTSYTLAWDSLICKEVLVNLFMDKSPFNFIIFIQPCYNNKRKKVNQYWSAQLLINTTEMTSLKAGHHKQGCWRLSCDRRDNSNVWSLLLVSFPHFLCLRTHHIKIPIPNTSTTTPPITPTMIAHRVPAEPE